MESCRFNFFIGLVGIQGEIVHSAFLRIQRLRSDFTFSQLVLRPCDVLSDCALIFEIWFSN